MFVLMTLNDHGYYIFSAPCFLKGYNPIYTCNDYKEMIQIKEQLEQDKPSKANDHTLTNPIPHKTPTKE